MARLKAANDAHTTLDGAITAGATSLVVASASGFPAVPFRIVVGGFEDGRLAAGAEIIEVGAKSGTTFSSLLRGQESITASSHADGADVDCVFTAGYHDELAASASVTSEIDTAIDGHNHTGAAGDGPQIDYDDLLNKPTTMTPANHADRHASGGADPVSPASIGAATTSHASTHATAGSDAVSPASIGAASTDDSRFPTAGEKAALAGSEGTPSDSNRYVTEAGAEPSQEWYEPSDSILEESLSEVSIFDDSTPALPNHMGEWQQIMELNSYRRTGAFRVTGEFRSEGGQTVYINNKAELSGAVSTGQTTYQPFSLDGDATDFKGGFAGAIPDLSAGGGLWVSSDVGSGMFIRNVRFRGSTFTPTFPDPDSEIAVTTITPA